MTKKLNRKEVAELGIYDFLGYIGAFDSPYIGGLDGTRRLIDQLKIPHDKEFRVLEVGCASGFTSCMIAKEYGCQVTGIDISEILVSKAQERADGLGLNNAHFQVANALKLPFEDGSFDAVYGVAIVALLPDKIQAFRELMRVVKPGGIVGTLDLFVKKDVDPKVIDVFSSTMSTLLGIDVSILDIDNWKSIISKTDFSEVDIEEAYRDVLILTRGRAGAAKATLKMVYHMIINGTVRRQMMKLMRLRKTATLTAEEGFAHLGYLVFTGRKVVTSSLIQDTV
ncbi:MAG: class I SAM-dependent methyltransferase [Candidatus Thorarchaeota archaeon]